MRMIERCVIGLGTFDTLLAMSQGVEAHNPEYVALGAFAGAATSLYSFFM